MALQHEMGTVVLLVGPGTSTSLSRVKPGLLNTSAVPIQRKPECTAPLTKAEPDCHTG